MNWANDTVRLRDLKPWENNYPAEKIATLTMKGGNTDTIYKSHDSRLRMALSLMRQHPDVVDVTYKWGRYQHKVDYTRFAANKLIRKQNISPPRIRFNDG